MNKDQASNPLAKQVRRSISIKFSYSSECRDLKEVMSLTEKGHLKPIARITGTLPLTKLDEAFSEIRASGRWVILTHLE